MSTLSEATLAPITRVQIARYAGAIGDFNPIHLDEPFARAAGLPSVIAHGPLTLALALDAVVSQVGATSLRRMDARLKAPVLPGEGLSVRPSEDGIEVLNDKGTLVASATLELAP